MLPELVGIKIIKIPTSFRKRFAFHTQTSIYLFLIETDDPQNRVLQSCSSPRQRENLTAAGSPSGNMAGQGPWSCSQDPRPSPNIPGCPKAPPRGSSNAQCLWKDQDQEGNKCLVSTPEICTWMFPPSPPGTEEITLVSQECRSLSALQHEDQQILR